MIEDSYKEFHELLISKLAIAEELSPYPLLSGFEYNYIKTAFAIEKLNLGGIKLYCLSSHMGIIDEQIVQTSLIGLTPNTNKNTIAVSMKKMINKDGFENKSEAVAGFFFSFSQLILGHLFPQNKEGIMKYYYVGSNIKLGRDISGEINNYFERMAGCGVPNNHLQEGRTLAEIVQNMLIKG
ncbi:hypothetical protein HY643_02230 [Candidatus Woesearchaeota archaeon]|nr:hypothetical protein [Candidatus Woesearchaeota archaeon]